MQANSRDSSAIALLYAQDIVSGKVDACKYVKQACQRHIDDLSADSEWSFNEKLANRACKFIELLPHTQGEWAKRRELLTLAPWQIFIVCNIFGWVDAVGLRRYRYVYIEVPRKNGKSTLMAAIGLLCAFFDNEQGSQVYSAATTRDQARIVWEEAHRMVQRLPALQKAQNIKAGQLAIGSTASSSIFKPLSRDQGGNQDGLNVHCGLVDELHAHKSSEMLDVLESATGARAQPLIISITTAGFDLYGVCYRERQTVMNILDGTQDMPRYFGIIYTIDEGDDWADPIIWQKANPNYGSSVNPTMLQAACDKAKVQATAQTNFLTKHLCIWVNARNAWLDMAAWNALADTSLKSEMFTADKAFIGLDLASKQDLAGKVTVFSRDVDGIKHYYVFSRQYINEYQAELPENKQYLAWAREGWLILTAGNATEFKQIEQDLIAECAEFDIHEIGFDPWNANYIAQRLSDSGIRAVEVPQRVQYLSEPMKWIEILVRSGRIHHCGDPVLSWAISNVTVKPDANDNIFPRKESIENKIDPAVALIIAMSRAVYFDEVGHMSIDDHAAFDDFINDPIIF